MADTSNTISFKCNSELFEKLESAARIEGLSIEDYIRRTVHEHIFPMAKVRREYRTPRRFHCYEVDPD